KALALDSFLRNFLIIFCYGDPIIFPLLMLFHCDALAKRLLGNNSNEYGQGSPRLMQFDQFKVLTFDVVGTLINFEKGVLDSVRRLGGDAAHGLSDNQIFAPYKRGRATHPGRSSQAMRDVYVYLAKELGLPADTDTADAFQLDVLKWP